MLRREKLIPLLIILTVGALFLLTLRPGHHWGDDFAMYLLHARNLVTGQPYSTGYVYNPAEPHTGSPAYGPVFPMLIAPAYKILGANYSVMKVIVILTFLVFLWAMFVMSAHYLSWGWRVALLVLVGFQPYLWNLRNDIISDMPFIMFLYLALAFAEHIESRYLKERPPLAAALLMGLLMYLVYGTRSVGLAIIPAFVLYDLLIHRKLTRFAIIAAGLTAFLGLTQAEMLKAANGADRIGLFDLRPSWLISNTIAYFKAERIFLVNGYSNLASYGIFFIAILLAVLGAWRQLRRRIHLLDLFALMYFPLIIAYMVPGLQRYLIPVLPLFFIYVLSGLQAVMDVVGHPRRVAAASLAAILIFFTYAGAYAKSDRGPIQEGVNDADFLEACHYLRDHAAPSDIVIFRKPRILALLTGMQGAVYNTTGTPEEIRAFVHQTHARYIVVASVPHEDFKPDAQNLLPALERYRDAVTEVYTNPHYRIFALHPDF